MNIIVNGSEIAKEIIIETAQQAAQIVDQYGVTPKVAFIALSKDDTTKLAELDLHIGAAQKAGVEAIGCGVGNDVTEQELLDLIDELNADNSIHGIMPILPLPDHVNEANVLAQIASDKEIEGLQENKEHVDELFVGRKVVILTSMILVLQRLGYDIYQGKNVLIMEKRIIEGNLVVIQLLDLAAKLNFPIDICQPDDPEAKALTQLADLLMVSVDTEGMVDKNYIKPGAILIDFNPLTVGEVFSEKRGYNVPVYGSGMAIDSLAETAGHIIPTLGGIGPVAIATLISNVVYNCSQFVEQQALSA